MGGAVSNAYGCSARGANLQMRLCCAIVNRGDDDGGGGGCRGDGVGGETLTGERRSWWVCNWAELHRVVVFVGWCARKGEAVL